MFAPLRAQFSALAVADVFVTTQALIIDRKLTVSAAASEIISHIAADWMMSHS